MYRNPAILKEARNHSCQLCGKNDGTIVAAHSNQLRHGKGKGIKAHDVFVAFLCYRCHRWVDEGDGEYDLKIAGWQMAHARSIQLFRHLLDKQAEQLLKENEDHEHQSGGD